MNSPFPGMDPYLEARWSDVHATLITLIKETLQPNLPPALRARSEERVLLETADEPEAIAEYRSDVAVVNTGRRAEPAPSALGATATIEPVRVKYYNAPEVDRFVQIIDRTNGNRVVTVIEVLSPWNKGPGRLNKDYLKKLDDYAKGSVNVVEVDLLRYPQRDRLPVGQIDLKPDRRTPYLVAIRHASDPSEWLIYPIPLRQPLPRIPIPLRQTDPDVGLELQPLIERVYIAGGHDDIDYTKPCAPPLDADDTAWAQSLLKSPRNQ